MTVAWYVHHQGAGHAARLAATAPHLDEPPVVLSKPHPTRRLDPRVGRPARWTSRASPEDADANGTLHGAPLRHAGLRARMATIADALPRGCAPTSWSPTSRSRSPCSPACSASPPWSSPSAAPGPTQPHALAYAQAVPWRAPWTPATRCRARAAADRPNAVFTGAISRFDAGPAFPLVAVPAATCCSSPASAGTTSRRRSSARPPCRTPERTHGTWRGRCGCFDGANVVDHGSTAPTSRRCCARCSVVVGSAGGNVVAEVAAARRPFVCLPQPRPFDEQADAGRPRSSGSVSPPRSAPAFPDAAEWPALLAAAEARDASRWSALHDGEGGRRLAALVQAAAVRPDAVAPARAAVAA